MSWLRYILASHPDTRLGHETQNPSQSIRFRLGRSEVEAFGPSGSIDGRVRFGDSSENDFRYKLQIVDEPEFTGSFADGMVTVSAPRPIGGDWVGSDELSISGSQNLNHEPLLNFLIEKDFVCLSAHNDEDQSDGYPQPNGRDAC